MSEEYIIASPGGTPWLVITADMDADTWTDAYFLGYRAPRYPMPAIYAPLAGNYFELGWRTAENDWNVESMYSMLGIQ